jgi:hypothetical protein
MESESMKNFGFTTLILGILVFAFFSPQINFVHASDTTPLLSTGHASPVVTIDDPSNDEWIYYHIIDAHGSAYGVDSDVTLVQVRVDEGDWINATGTTSWSIHDICMKDSLSEGNHTIYVQAIDKDEDVGYASVNIRIDNSAPTFAITSHDKYAWVGNSSFTLSGIANDSGSGLYIAIVYVEDTTVWDYINLSGTTTSWSVTLGPLSAGNHVIQVSVSDMAQNDDMKEITVRAGDEALPVIAINHPSNNQPQRHYIGMGGTVTDDGYGISSVRFGIDGTHDNIMWFDAQWTTTGGITSWGYTLSTDGFPEGNRTLYVLAVDGIGNVNYASTHITIDESPPTLNITYPGHLPSQSRIFYYAWVGNSSFTVTGTATDPLSGISGVTYYIDNDGWYWASGTTSWSIPLGPLSDGTHRLMVGADDWVGNNQQIELRITVDTHTSSVSINSGEQYTNTNSVTLTLSSIASSGTKNMTFSNDGSNWSNWEDFGTSKAWTLPAGDGIKTVYAKFMDYRETESPVFSDSIILDMNPPTGSISINGGEPYSTSPVVSLTLSGLDANGVTKMAFSNDGSTWSSWEDYATSKTYTLPSGEGTRRVYVEFQDVVGLNSTAYFASIVLDLTDPSVSITEPTALWSTSATVNFAGTANGGGSPVSTVECQVDETSGSWIPATGLLHWSFTATLTQGTHTVYVRATDVSGRSNMSSINVKIDLTDPTIAITTPSSSGLWFASSSIDFAGTYVVGGSNIEAVDYKVDSGSWTTVSGLNPWQFTVSKLTEGTHTAYVRATASSGRTNTASVLVKVDTVKPSVSISNPTDGSAINNNKPTITITASDDGSSLNTVTVKVGVNTYSASLVSGNTWAYTFTSSLADGSYSVTSTATDKAGNTQTSSAVSLKVDTTPPVTGHNYDLAWHKSSITVTLSASDTGGSGVSGTFYKINGGSTETTIDCQPTISTEGLNTLEYWSTDNVGNNEAHHTITVKIDYTAPVTTEGETGTIGLNNWYTSSVTVTLTATDSGSDVKEIHYVLNGVTKVVSGNSASFTISTAGVNNLSYWSVDNVGNDETSHSTTVKVDLTDPTISITSPANNAQLPVGSIQLAGTASESTSGIWKVEVKVDSGNYALATGTTTWEFDTSALSPGTHTITAKATDNAGDTKEASVTVYSGGTTLTNNGAYSGQYSDQVTVSATLADKATGNGVSGKTITFTIGTQSTTAVTNGSGIATGSITLTQPAGTGYNIASSFSGDSSYAASSDSDAFTINKEVATISYIGDTFDITNGASTWTVHLAAALVQQADGNNGDINLAKVTFNLFKSGNLGSTPDKTIADVTVGANGVASTSVTIACDVWTVVVSVDSSNQYWKQDEVAYEALTVTMSTTSTASGGGWIHDSSSTNGKGNFGFNVGYQKGTTPKGSFVYIYRGADGYNYVVKSNSWQGGTLSFTAKNAAYFSGKCVIQKIDPSTGAIVASWGNSKFSVWVTDNSQNGGTDKLAISFSAPTGATTYTNRTIGTAASEVAIGGGNIIVHNKATK